MDEATYNQIFSELKDRLIKRFDQDLKPDLYYHNTAHTLDVLEQVMDIALSEGITDPKSIFILKVAALFHDAGFLYVYVNHEARSCQIMKEEIAPYNLPEDVLSKISDLIMMTKLPPYPVAHLEQIMCDADLDYLGREDFEEISHKLRDEFITYGIVKDVREWEERQIRFFEHHRFFTQTSQLRRSPLKNEILIQLKKNFHS